jgi:hypothetical protein
MWGICEGPAFIDTEEDGSSSLSSPTINEQVRAGFPTRGHRP